MSNLTALYAQSSDTCCFSLSEKRLIAEKLISGEECKELLRVCNTKDSVNQKIIKDLEKDIVLADKQLVLSDSIIVGHKTRSIELASQVQTLEKKNIKLKKQFITASLTAIISTSVALVFIFK